MLLPMTSGLASGAMANMPVSCSASTTPSPVAPMAQAAGARTRSRCHGADRPAAANATSSPRGQHRQRLLLVIGPLRQPALATRTHCLLRRARLRLQVQACHRRAGAQPLHRRPRRRGGETVADPEPCTSRRSPARSSSPTAAATCCHDDAARAGRSPALRPAWRCAAPSRAPRRTPATPRIREPLRPHAHEHRPCSRARHQRSIAARRSGQDWPRGGRGRAVLGQQPRGNGPPPRCATSRPHAAASPSRPSTRGRGESGVIPTAATPPRRRLRAACRRCRARRCARRRRPWPPAS